MGTTYTPSTQCHRLWIQDFLGLDPHKDYGATFEGSRNQLIRRIISDPRREISPDRDSSCTILLSYIRSRIVREYARELKCYHAVGTRLQHHFGVDMVLYIPTIGTCIKIRFLTKSNYEWKKKHSGQSRKNRTDDIYYICYPDSFEELTEEAIGKHGYRIAGNIRAISHELKAIHKAETRKTFDDRPEVHRKRSKGKPTFPGFFRNKNGKKPCNKNKHGWGDKKERKKLLERQKKEKELREEKAKEYKKHPNPHQNGVT